MKTLFERILSGELPCEKVYEDAHMVAIKDKYPKAPVHLLVITRKPIPNLHSLSEEDLTLLPALFRVIQKLAEQFGLDEEGYRVVVNNGPDGGQEVEHLHFHLLGGRHLGPMA